MSTAAATRPTAPSAGRAHSAPFGAALSVELTKLLAPWRMRLLAMLCAIGPAAFIGVVGAQSTLPADTAFGRWMNQSGLAGSLVVLGFCCSWVLPLLTSLVAGDVFAVEDRLGTWRHLVMAVRSPRRIFAAKAVASLAVVEGLIGLLFLSSLVGGVLLVGAHPLVGLDGQQLAPGHAAVLVLGAWAVAAVTALAFAGVGLLGSVLLGRSPLGLLLPALLALALDVAQMLPLPLAVRMALPGQGFLAWRGLFSEPGQRGPVLVGLAVAVLWTVVTVALARWLFLRRDFTDLAYDGAARRTVLSGLLPLVLLVALCAGLLAPVAGRAGTGITRGAVERQVATTFGHLYRLQTRQLGRPDATEAQLGTTAECGRGGDPTNEDSTGPGADWRCVVTWHLPGVAAVGNATYQLDVAPDGRVRADGDGPVAVNGYFPVPGPAGPAPNPLWQFDSLVDLLGRA